MPRLTPHRSELLCDRDSLGKADRPEFVAHHAVRLDWITAVKQSQYRRAGKPTLGLPLCAARARGYERDRFMHAVVALQGRTRSPVAITSTRFFQIEVDAPRRIAVATRPEMADTTNVRCGNYQ